MSPRVGRVLVTLALVTAFACAGCIGSDAVEDSFEDADERYTNTYDGGHQRAHTFQVASGTQELRVALHYEVTGGFDVQLMSPAGLEDQSSEGGSAEQKDASWFTTSQPTAGEWRLQVSGGGTGAYAFGVYLD